MGPLAFVFVVASCFADGFADTATAAQPGAGVAAVFDSIGRNFLGFAVGMVLTTIAVTKAILTTPPGLVVTMNEVVGLLPTGDFPRWLAFLLLSAWKQVVHATFVIGGTLSTVLRFIKPQSDKHGEFQFSPS